MTNLRALVGLAWAALTSRSNQAFYDQIAPFYDKIFKSHKLHAQTIVRELSNLYPGREKEMVVLDLGCGTGMLSRLLATKGFSVIGLDVSFNSLSILEKGLHLPVVQGSAEHLPFADRSFHCVVCLGVWRHFPTPEKVAEETARILSDDGVLIVGYFPPAIGGLIQVSDKHHWRLLTSFYQALIKWLGYSDRADSDLEKEAITEISRKYETVDKIASGERWRLITASHPSARNAT